jgi:predicted nucleotidyltransferase component of viral defense system
MKDVAIEEWVNSTSEESVLELRQAMHTVITAIGCSKYLYQRMTVKGGVLLAIKYRSTRFTKDVDFSTSEKYDSFDKEKFLDEMGYNLLVAIEKLPYDLDCRIQSVELSPSKGGTFPTLQLKVGYAYKATSKHRRLLSAAGSPTSIRIDYSFNETNIEIDCVEIEKDTSVRAYSIVDLVGEKYRAILQQPERNRIRRQDMYDIFWLISNDFLKHVDMSLILKSLIVKAESRGLSVDKGSIRDPEVARRSRAEYDTLKSEIEGELPEFDVVYNATVTLYELLPWGEC